MTNAIQPFHLLVIALAGWLNRHQQAVINYLLEENRVHGELPVTRRLRSAVLVECTFSERNPGFQHG